MKRHGFANVPIGSFAFSQAKLLLRLHYPSEGYNLQFLNDSLFLGWKNRLLFSVSSWKWFSRERRNLNLGLVEKKNIWYFLVLGQTKKWFYRWRRWTVAPAMIVDGGGILGCVSFFVSWEAETKRQPNLLCSTY